MGVSGSGIVARPYVGAVLCHISSVVATNFCTFGYGYVWVRNEKKKVICISGYFIFTIANRKSLDNLRNVNGPY